MGQTVSRKDFLRVGTDEPHATRRKLILEKYPQIKELYGPDSRTFPIVMAMVALQLGCAVISPHLSWFQFVALAYLIGGTITHALSLANHELSHNLCFHTPIYNELLAMVANFAQGMPSCITFKKYHLEHHYFQGVEGVDTDIPTPIEGWFFNNTLKKIVWAFLQPLFYALRPMMVKPKTPCLMEIINFVTCISFDLMLVYFIGWCAVGYLLLSTVLGMGLHPVAGHFIAEHYVFHEDQETYSYYGPLNWLCFNVGYHNEHHDFPKVSGVNLPKVREIASEFYDDRKIHASWIQVIIDYIRLSDIGPFSRVKRAPRSERVKSD